MGCSMAQSILVISGLCLMAALCEQLLGDSRFFGVVRLALGLEIVLEGLALLDKLRRIVN